jgi:Flp pilus assembly pilin Flp
MRMLHDESGVTSMEYGLIGVLVSLSLIGGAIVAGGSVNTMFQAIGAALTAAAAAAV